MPVDLTFYIAAFLFDTIFPQYLPFFFDIDTDIDIFPTRTSEQQKDYF